MAKQCRRRTPKLCFTRNQGIGYHVSFRDPRTGTPRRHRFGMIDREEAEAQYHEWVVARMRGTAYQSVDKPPKWSINHPKTADDQSKQQAVPGSLILVVASWTRHESGRTRKHGDVSG